VKIIKIIALFISISLFPTVLLAGQTSVPDKNLSSLIQEALQNNPQIKSARNRWLAEQYTISQARSLPDPQIGVTYSNVPAAPGDEVDAQRETMYGLQQEVPFPGKLYNNGKIASLQAQRLQQDYYATTYSIIAELKKTYFELYLANKSRVILSKNKFILTQIVQEVRTQYSVGKVPQQDLFRAQVEVSRLSMQLIELQQRSLTLEADINRLLNRQLSIRIATPANLPVTVFPYTAEQLFQKLNSLSPQLQAQLLSLQKDSKMIIASKLDYMPDFDVGAYRIHDNVMHTKGYQVMVGATVPLYFMTKQNNEVKQAQFNYAAGTNDLTNIKQGLLLQLNNDFIIEQRSADLISLVRDTILPQANFSWQAAKASYGTGRVDFLTLLNSFLVLQENELDLQNEIVDHEKAIADIQAILGSSV
jgi:outer membrane protein TolC